MIQAIELENFKGIGLRQRVEFAPLTLLFGPNNAGKSTILDALLYVLDVLETGRADIDRTQLGGLAVDLGGFARLVHRHDLSSAISLRVEFDCRGSLNVFGRPFPMQGLEDLDDSIENVWLELRMASVQTAGGWQPAVHEFLVGIPGVEAPLVDLRIRESNRVAEPITVEVNRNHPVLATLAASTDGEVFNRERCVFALPALRPGCALPELNEPVRLIADEGETERDAAVGALLIEMLVLGPASLLVRLLKSTMYIGPLRAVPPRGFFFERSFQPGRWADGLAAWDALATSPQLTSRTNQWLDTLGAGIEVKHQTLLAQGEDAEHTSGSDAGGVVRRLVLQAGNVTLLPSEVGTGVSQVVPIVVASLMLERGRLALFEQPELHVHPALQVELGDLFVKAADGAQLIVETHSEHIVLRLLRRIRETSENGGRGIAISDGDGPIRLPILLKPETLSVIYVEPRSEGTSIRRLRVDATGEFIDRWPRGFFEERSEELF